MGEIDGHANPVPTGPQYTPDDGSWFSDTFANIEEATATAASRAAYAAQQVGPATSGPGFAFDHDQLISIAGKWEDLAEGFRHDRETASFLPLTDPPGKEYASRNNAQQIRDSGSVMAEGLGAREQYCGDQAIKFKKAAGEYQKADEEASSNVTGQSGGIV